MSTPAVASDVVALKAEADRKVGEMRARLTACGPQGNRFVSTQLDHWEGRSSALADVLALLVAPAQVTQ